MNNKAGPLVLCSTCFFNSDLTVPPILGNPTWPGLALRLSHCVNTPCQQSSSAVVVSFLITHPVSPSARSQSLVLPIRGLSCPKIKVQKCLNTTETSAFSGAESSIRVSPRPSCLEHFPLLTLGHFLL